MKESITTINIIISTSTNNRDREPLRYGSNLQFVVAMKREIEVGRRVKRHGREDVRRVATCAIVLAGDLRPCGVPLCCAARRACSLYVRGFAPREHTTHVHT